MRRRTAVAVVMTALLLVSGGLRAASERPDGSRAELRMAADELYRSPISLALSHDDGSLYVVCEGIDALLVVDTASREVVGRVDVGRKPFAVTLSPDGRLAYVSNRWDDSVSVVDTVTLEVVGGVATGGDPHGLVIDPSGETLFVANLYSHDVSLIDTASRTEIKRLRAGRQPFEVALSRDGDQVWVSNQLTAAVPFRTAPRCEVTVLDAERQLVAERRWLDGTDIGQGIASSPDGELVLVAVEVPKNLIPETQLYQGWMVTYGLAVVETRRGGRSALVLLDEVNRYLADPFDVVFSPDGSRAWVTSSGVDVVSVVAMDDLRRVLAVTEGAIGASDESLAVIGRNLGLSSDFVVARIPTGRNPKGMALSADGRLLYVANRLDDTVGVIDTSSLDTVAEIDLGGPAVVTQLRHGEYLFNHAVISFQQQLSCNTCHPESNVDGLIYDIAVDGGLGGNLVDNRSMRGVAFTGPFKWSGKNPTLARQEGPRAAQLFFRSHGFTGADRDAVVAFIEATPLSPNRHRDAEDGLNPTQRRGKALFERDRTREGRYIPVANRCVTCHPPPYFTDRSLHDVGTKAYFDTHGVFDTPQLNNVGETAPYLHDGRCWSLEEIWTVYNPYDLHGVANDMTKQQLNDLIEYLKTL
jgi:YVTN family beta-propeller protein